MCPFDIMYTRLNADCLPLIFSLQIRTLEHTCPRFFRLNANFRTLLLLLALDAQADALVTVRAGQGESIRGAWRLYCLVTKKVPNRAPQDISYLLQSV